MRLFISYARVDKPLVEQIIEIFREGGHDPWFDHRLLPGQEWKQVLLKQIRECDVFAYMLSPEAVKSEWCQWEFAEAVKLGKPIIPVLLQKNTPIPVALSCYQYADFSDGITPKATARLMGGLGAIVVTIPLEDMPQAPLDPLGLPAQASQDELLQVEPDTAYQVIEETEESPLRVVAGPGTGKTTALMKRLAKLLEKGVDPQRILLVTFTRTAAEALKEEVIKLGAVGAQKLNPRTLHSYCFSVLFSDNYFFLTGRTARPMLEFEERFLLEDLDIDNTEFGNFYARRRRLKAFESAWAREQDQEPGWAIDETDRRFQRTLIDWLRFHQAMLLSEIVPETLKYLRDNPACQELSRFDHVLVDEYQDLNRAEQSLIDILSSNASLTIIGDEDQSIYESFRYAHPEGIADFEQTHQNTLTVPLSVCHRCPRLIVEIANRLISNNTIRTDRILSPKEGNPEGEIHIVQWPDMQTEALGIAKFIDHKINSGEFDPGQVLILCPRRQFGYLIRDALRDVGRAAHSFFHEEILEGNPKRLKGCQAQEAFTLLTLAANLRDRVALRCWLGFGDSNLRARECQFLRTYCDKEGIDPIDALNAVYEGRLSISGIRNIMQRYRLLLQYMDAFRMRTGREIFDEIFPQGQEWAESFRSLADDFVEEWSVEGILDVLQTNVTQPELPSDVGYIRVMSLHKSKGLTADHVIVTGCIEGLLPTVMDENLTSEQKERVVEEQRRLFYVAITRPRKTLVLSSVLRLPRDVAHKMRAKIVGNRGTGQTITSKFISELGPQCPRPVCGANWRY